MPKLDDDQVRHIEGLVRPLIRSMRRNMKIVMGEDDLSQECLIRVLTSSREVWEDNYLRRLARNVCLDQFRAEKTEKKRLAALPPAEALNSDAALELWLDALLKHAPWELAKTVRLKMKGFDNQEIADQTGTSVRTVNRRLIAVARFVEKQMEQ